MTSSRTRSNGSAANRSRPSRPSVAVVDREPGAAQADRGHLADRRVILDEQDPGVHGLPRAPASVGRFRPQYASSAGQRQFRDQPSRCGEPLARHRTAGGLAGAGRAVARRPTVGPRSADPGRSALRRAARAAGAAVAEARRRVADADRRGPATRAAVTRVRRGSGVARPPAGPGRCASRCGRARPGSVRPAAEVRSPGARSAVGRRRPPRSPIGRPRRPASAGGSAPAGSSGPARSPG